MDGVGVTVVDGVIEIEVVGVIVIVCVGVNVTDGVTEMVKLGVTVGEIEIVTDGVTEIVTLGVTVGEIVLVTDGVTEMVGVIVADGDRDTVVDGVGVTGGVVETEVDTDGVSVGVVEVVKVGVGVGCLPLEHATKLVILPPLEILASPVIAKKLPCGEAFKVHGCKLPSILALIAIGLEKSIIALYQRPVTNGKLDVDNNALIELKSLVTPNPDGCADLASNLNTKPLPPALHPKYKFIKSVEPGLIKKSTDIILAFNAIAAYDPPVAKIDGFGFIFTLSITAP